MNEKVFHRRIACTYPSGESVFVEELLPNHDTLNAGPEYKLLPSNEPVTWVEERKVFQILSRRLDISPKNEFSPAHPENVKVGLRLLYG